MTAKNVQTPQQLENLRYAVFGNFHFEKTSVQMICLVKRIRGLDTEAVPNARWMKLLRPLSRSFYAPSAEAVAPALLGHWLIRLTPAGLAGGPIVETEAYLVGDAACHAAPGLTQRNRVMFGPPGHAYIYLIYGYHFCVNAVCRPPGTAEAVLIRAVEAEFGQSILFRQRAVAQERHLTNGPAKLCEAMGIDRELDGADLCDRRSGLIIAENPGAQAFRHNRGPIVVTVRVGITRAAELPLRFYLDGSAFVSKRIRGGIDRGRASPNG